MFFGIFTLIDFCFLLFSTLLYPLAVFVSKRNSKVVERTDVTLLLLECTLG